MTKMCGGCLFRYCLLDELERFTRFRLIFPLVVKVEIHLLHNVTGTLGSLIIYSGTYANVILIRYLPGGHLDLESYLMCDP